MSSSYSSVNSISVLDRFHHVVYHNMDDKSQVDLTRYLFGYHATDILTLSDGGHNTMKLNSIIRSASYLGDPNDFRRHDFLSNRGSILALWQDQSFASGNVCGWKSITRTDCLAIGCCYRDDFPALHEWILRSLCQRSLAFLSRRIVILLTMNSNSTDLFSVPVYFHDGK